MKRIIGYTDSITECECCGKIELKGTFCIEIDSVELYYGSVCAFKEHGMDKEEQKKALQQFKANKKHDEIISELYELGLEYKQEVLMKWGKYGTTFNPYWVKMLKYIKSKNLNFNKYITDEMEIRKEICGINTHISINGFQTWIKS